MGPGLRRDDEWMGLSSLAPSRPHRHPANVHRASTRSRRPDVACLSHRAATPDAGGAAL